MNLKLLLLVSCLLLTTTASVRAQADPAAPPPEETPPVVDTSQANVEQPRRPRRSPRSGQRDTVMIGAPITIREGESVHDVVGIAAPIVIDGTVNGDLVSVLGKVKLGPKARIERDLIVVGAALESDPAAHLGRSPVVIGSELMLALTNVFPAELAIAGKEWIESGLFRARPLPFPGPGHSTLPWLIAGACVLLYLLVEVLFPKTVRATVDALEEKPGSAFMTGVLASFLSLPLLALLIITVVGIAVVPFAACALAGMFVLGKTSVYHFAGQTLTGRLGRNGFAGSLVALMVGASLFYLLYCVPILGAIAWILCGLMGLGGVLLTVLGRSRSTAPAASVPIPGTSGLGLPGAPATTETTWPRAGFWIRLLASLLDFALVTLIIFATLRKPTWFPLVWLAYHLGFWIWQGTTIGGIICSLRIVRVDGQRLSPAAAVVRLLGSIFSLVVAGLGFFWAGWSADKQSWHDKIAGTTVVRLPRSPALV